MIQNTLFKLKPEEEILKLLENVGHIYFLACKKCCREFTEDTVSECTTIASLAAGKITGCTDLDFLCNSSFHEETFKEIEKNPTKADAIGVYACGVGVQAVASRLSLPVFSLADTIPQGGQHGVSLDKNKCFGCFQCYLGLTAGICPLVSCSKQLLNGQCGGAKNGKCEVSKDKDCGWEKIYGNLKISHADFASVPVQVHKYNKPDFKTRNRYNFSIRQKREQNFYGGLYPFENKHYTSDKPVQLFPEADIIIIPLSQHTGSICEPLVKVGDMVKLGQKIGDSKSFISAPVHSSVSGEVVAIEQRPHPVIPSGVLSVVIKSDCKNQPDTSIKPAGDFENLSKDELVNIIREKGIVGMGGAQFPTYVKLKSQKPIDTLIINGCECEPYITADDRLMIEHPKKIVTGVKILLKALSINKSLIAIESNKQQAIKSIKESIETCGYANEIQVVELPTKYPQGAERMLIRKVTGKDVPLGGLPLDVGVVVNNVGTAFAVHDAVINGMPLIERVITVTGDKVKNKMNLKVKIGTPVSEILEYCGLEEEGSGDYVIKLGGPMMGLLQENKSVPVIKGTTCVLSIMKPEIEKDIQRTCIKCGRCVDACPMELYPLYYWYNYKNSDKTPEDIDKRCTDILSKKKNYGVVNCIECGCCEYICPSKLPLIPVIKELKNANNRIKR